MNQLTLTDFQNADNSEKVAFIEKQLLETQSPDFYSFLEEIFLQTDYQTKKKAVEVIATKSEKALEAAKYLLMTTHPNDDLSSLKYYGAMILKETGAKLDYKITIPLLVAAYNTDDYRDARWSIAMALSSFINEPVQIIKNELKEHPDAASELSVHLRSYTTLDFED